MPDLRIAIVGAGPAGSMLARLLHLEGIQFTIFEGESALDFRSQGGTLDLHVDTGLAAIKRAGLYSEFLEHARFDGEAMTITDKNLFKYICMGGTKEGSSRGRPEIDRPRLREILIKSLPEGCIQWGKQLKSIDSDLKLHFDDGVDGGFDLVVGADGAWSRVRPLLSHVIPFYSGIAGYQSSIPNAKDTQPEISKLVNKGSLFALSDGKSIIGQQMGDGSILTSTWGIMDEGRTKKILPEEAVDVREHIKNTYHDWSTELLDFVLQSDPNTIVYRPLHMLPIGHSWKHKPGVTLLGDAAHLMTPFAGEGVNLAFKDAIELADAIIDASHKSAGGPAPNAKHSMADYLSDKVDSFEKDMFYRATKVQQLTYDMMHTTFFMPGPPQKVIRTFVLRAVSDEIPWVLHPVVAALLYAYFFFLRVFY